MFNPLTVLMKYRGKRQLLRHLRGEGLIALHAYRHLLLISIHLDIHRTEVRLERPLAPWGAV